MAHSYIVLQSSSIDAVYTLSLFYPMILGHTFPMPQTPIVRTSKCPRPAFTHSIFQVQALNLPLDHLEVLTPLIPWMAHLLEQKCIPTLLQRLAINKVNWVIGSLGPTARGCVWRGAHIRVAVWRQSAEACVGFLVVLQLLDTG